MNFTWNSLSIKWKLLIVMVLIVLIPLIITGFFIQQENQAILKGELDKQGRTNLKVVKSFLDNRGERLKQIGTSLLRDNELMNQIKAEHPTRIYVKLKKIVDSEDVDFATFVTPNGTVIRRGNNSRNYQDKLPFPKVFERLREEEEEFNTYLKYPADILAKEDTPNHQLSQQLIVDGKKQDGLVLMSVIPVKIFNELTGAFLVGEVLNNNPNLYSGRLENIVLNNSQDEQTYFSGLKLNGEYINAAQDFWTPKEGLQDSVQKLGEDYIMYQKTVENTAGEGIGRVTYGVSREKLAQSKQDNLYTMLKIILSVVVVVVLLVVFMAHKVDEKIKIIFTKFKQIADGDLTTRLKLDRDD